MKRIALISACILSAFAFSSCSKQEEPTIPLKEVSIIHATLPQPVSDSGTKTELGVITSGKYPILWSKGDAVAVVAEGSAVSTKYTLSDESAGKKVGEFTGASVIGPVYAYYPCDSVKSISGDVFTVSIPATQTYSSGSFGKGAMPSYGKSSSADGIQLNSLMSVIKVQLTGSTRVSRITVTSTGSFLSGEAAIDMTDGTVTFASGSSHSVELVCEEPVQLTSEPTAFHIVLPACTDDFSVLVETAAGYMEKTLTGKTFKVNTIKKMSALEFAANVTPYIEGGHHYGKGIKIGDVTWAPVNCGVGADSSATNGCGLLYQWGRLYGQSYEAGTLALTAMTMAEGQNSASKDKFGEYNTTDYNWFTGGVVNTLWNTGTESSPAKNTSYDPCPDGWRVPTESEIIALKNSGSSWTATGGPNSNQSGYLFGTSPNQLFLPAAGSRLYSDGSAYRCGSGGGYWSSSVNGKFARDMYFSGVSLNMYDIFRTNGCSVRCVQE